MVFESWRHIGRRSAGTGREGDTMLATWCLRRRAKGWEVCIGGWE